MFLDYVLLGLLVIVIACLIYMIIIIKRSDNNGIMSDIQADNNRNKIELEKQLLVLDTKFETIVSLLNEKLSNNEKKVVETKEDINKSFSELREYISLSFQTINKTLEDRIHNLNTETQQKLTDISKIVSDNIHNLQLENSKKLSEIKDTVDEKLQKTLEDKLAKSFAIVSENLEKVYRGIGEMQSLANGVGDLKKVLSNVKTRGILGEIQLGNILDQILSPEQYVTNFITKKGTNNPVEFAIKLPGDENRSVYLPIDAKFPLDTYQDLLNAYDTGDSEIVNKSLKSLTQKIKLFAKDINTKYIDSPNTTEFAIMFLPVEGLYAEVVKSGVTEEIQREYKINVAGPTTMAALLNSLQMGFKTLAIQKRSSEVWKLLSAVRTEFDSFGECLASTQKKIIQASDELDKLVGVRTRQIQRKLKSVTQLPDVESKAILMIDEDKE